MWYWPVPKDWITGQSPRGCAAHWEWLTSGGLVFLEARLEGLYDEPRPGAPRKVSDDQVEQVVIQTLRGLAKASGLSRMTISRIWHAFGLQPHRADTFKLSPDPQLIEKVRDIVGLYMNHRACAGVLRG